MVSFDINSAQNTSESLPNMISARFGQPTNYWVYRNKKGIPAALVVRYDPPAPDKKQYSQWHYNPATLKWVPKSHPDLRPLYNLDKIDRNPASKIVVCEGEKAAEAAQELLGDDYISTCWMGGAQAMNKTDISPLYNRHVLLWPDADEPGVSAMGKLSTKICLNVSSIAAINPKKSDPTGFDAADLLETAPDQDKIDEYIKSRIDVLKAIPVEKTKSVPLSADQSPISTGVATIYSEDEQEADNATESRVMIKWQDLSLIMKTPTKVYQNETNILKILNKSFDEPVAFYDIFFKSYMSNYKVAATEKITDISFTRFKLALQSEYLFGDISTSTIKEAVRYYAAGTVRNTVADYIRTLKWDGIPRINSFFTDIYAAPLSEYTVAASRIFWLSMVARILNPGVKADIMIILEGMQGIMKTASIKEIANIMGQDFYDVAGKDPTNKDFYIKLQGKFLIEMGEISTLLKTSDEDLKEMLSTETDNYRIPYATEATPNPRTNVFIGTTNQSNYLRDDTGSRRFLPIFCKDVNMDQLKQDKLQYFAEAVHRKLAGEDHWIFPKELAKEETDNRMEIEDPWHECIEAYCAKLKNIKTTDIFESALGLYNKRDQTRRELNRIVKILRILGYSKEVIRAGNSLHKVWTTKNAEKTLNSWEIQPKSNGFS